MRKLNLFEMFPSKVMYPCDRYSQSSFTLTSKNNANASFWFYGTGVQVFGAKRNNHGPYQVTIDSTTYAQVSGQAVDPGSFQTSLFSTVALTNGFHKVTIVNIGSTFLDIDFVRELIHH